MRRAFVVVIAAACACGGGAPESASKSWPEPAKDAIVKTTESGPVKATVAVWPPKPTLGDSIQLRLTVEAQRGVVLDVPFERDVLGGFRVVAYDARHEHGKDGGAIEVRMYELEAPSSGRHRIPPMRLEFVDGRPGTGTGTGKLEILTDEVPIEVGGVSADRTGADLKPAKTTIDPMLGRRSPWPWILGAAAIALVAIAGVYATRAARRRRVVRAQVSAYEAALAALAALERRGAPGADDADAWFVELSAIVRRYLEGRFHVRAPELTTEEFLNEARRSAELDDVHRDRLIEFLERCDRVKFAGWRPAPEESLATLGAARVFVEETRLAEPAAPPAAHVARAA
jgi:hypothetical protein